MKKLPIFILLVILLSGGCVQRYVQIDTKDGHKLKFRLPSLGSRSKVKVIEVRVDGIVIRAEGYESDQVEAFKAGVSAGEKIAKSVVMP